MDRSDDRATDDSTTTRDTDAIARAVFSGLRPSRGDAERTPFWKDSAVSGAQRQQPRVAKTADKPAKRGVGRAATMPIVIAGAVAISTLNLTGNLDAVAQPQPDEPGEHHDGVRGLAAAATATRVASVEPVRALAAVPSSYTVADGDTVSGIAEQFGLSTAGILALNGLSWRSSIYPGQTLTLRNGIAAAPTAAGSASSAGSYTIQEGDTIAGIAAAHGLATVDLLEANGLSWSSTIFPGQSIVLPGADRVVPALPGAPELIAHETEASPAEAAPEQAPVEQALAVQAPAASVDGARHTVGAGETISAIAARYGVTVTRILEANGLSRSSIIYPGSELVIPGASASSGSPSGGSTSGGSTTGSSSAPAPTAPAGGATGTITTLNATTRANAQVIVNVGRQLGVPDYGIVIALATAMQESSLRNIDYGDRDSVGLFQQRPSFGWGSAEQILDPAFAARAFYTGTADGNRGLLDIGGWQSMSLTQAAQAVQISAHPTAYAKWEASAWSWLSELG
ncbi:MAG: LysM peptidoglycan-binding domain-containing protein [Microbacteriaceae bacterium]